MTTTEKRKYHTIRVPVKKTSSEYYTMLRRGKVEPEKYCAYCGARLHRKYNKENGRWEDWSQFLNRKCCVQLAITYRGDFQYKKDGELVVEDVKISKFLVPEVFKIKEKLMLAVHGIKIKRVYKPTDEIL